MTQDQAKLQAAYKAVFSGENGKTVLLDLLKEFPFFITPEGPNQEPMIRRRWPSEYILGRLGAFTQEQVIQTITRPETPAEGALQ